MDRLVIPGANVIPEVVLPELPRVLLRRPPLNLLRTLPARFMLPLSGSMDWRMGVLPLVTSLAERPFSVTVEAFSPFILSLYALDTAFAAAVSSFFAAASSAVILADVAPSARFALDDIGLISSSEMPRWLRLRSPDPKVSTAGFRFWLVIDSRLPPWVLFDRMTSSTPVCPVPPDSAPPLFF